MTGSMMSMQGSKDHMMTGSMLSLQSSAKANHSHQHQQHPLGSEKGGHHFDIATNLHAAFEHVLESLQISGHRREDVLKRTSDTQKRAIVAQYMRNSKKPEIDISYLNGADLDRELEFALDDLKMNPSAKAAVLKTMPESNKRILLIEYLKKPGKSLSKSKSKDTSQINPPPLPPRPDDGDDLLNKLQQDPGFYILKLADRNTSLKSLVRHLANLQINLSLAVASEIETFLVTEVNVNGQKVSGAYAFEIALNRVVQLKSFEAATASASQSYSDSVLDDELRLQILHCLAEVIKKNENSVTIVATPGLVKQIAFCLAVPASFSGRDKQLQLSNITLRIESLTLLEAFCLILPEGARLALEALRDLSAMQSEPGRFYSCVSSLLDPFQDAFAETPEGDFIEDIAMAQSYDLDLIWNLRARFLTLFNTLLAPKDEEDSKEDLEERMRVRSELESHGLLQAFSILKTWNATEDVLEQIEIYEEDRTVDLEGMEANYRQINGAFRDPSDVLKDILEITRSLPEPERSLNAMLKTINNVYSVLSTIKSAKDDVLHRSLEGERQNGEIASEYSIISLQILERLSGTVSGNTASWIGKGKRQSTTRRAKMQTLASEVIHSIEYVAGVPLHLGTGRNKGSTNSSETAKELANLKYLYNETLLTNDELRKENEQIRAKLEQSGLKASEDAAHTAAIQKEMRQLQDAIATLQIEKEELREKLYPTAAKPGDPEPEFKPPPAPVAVGPLPTFEVPEPVVPLLPLLWTKVPPRYVHNSVWKALVERVYISDNSLAPKILDQTEIQQVPQIFMKSTEPMSPKAVTASSKARRVAITIIDMTRARNMEILLASLRKSYGAAKDALLSIDDEFLTSERLSLLKQCIPTDEEIEIVQNYDGDKSELGNAEKFITVVASIPRLPQRIESLVYRNKFNEELDDLVTDLVALKEAALALRSSEKFQYTLQVVLVVGNYMNSGTYRGKAYGFLLQGLSELEKTKANSMSEWKDRAPTLLHYVARRIDELEPDNINLKDELSAIELATQGKGLKAIRDELEALQHLPHIEGDWFKDVMGAFIASSEVRVNEVTQKAKDIEDIVHSVLSFFGEDDTSKVSIPDDFFRVVWEFQKALLRAHSENIAMEDLWKKRGKNASALTRRSAPTPMFLALQAKRNRLKAVEGALPFSQRLTVRRPRNFPLPTDGEELLNIAPRGSSLSDLVAARSTMRRMKTTMKAVAKGTRKPIMGAFDESAERTDIAVPTISFSEDVRDDSARATPTGVIPDELQKLLLEAEEWERDQGSQEGSHISPQESFLAGALAGAVEATITYPTEYVKTRLQLQKKASPLLASGATAHKPLTLWQMVTTTVRDQGFFSLYRGVSAMVLGTASKASVRFLVFDSIKAALADKETGKITGSRMAIAGLGAGVIEAITVVTPSETIKTKLIEDQARAVSQGTKPKYRGLFQGVREIVRECGVTGIYQGVTAVVARQGANQAVRLTVYGLLKEWATDKWATDKWNVKGASKEKQALPWYATFGIGAVAGIVTVYTTMPLDVLKTKMQGLEARAEYKNTLDCLVKTVKGEGVFALWKGATPRLGRLIFSGGIVFAVYEEVIKVNRTGPVRPEAAG
ncbi:hypothetical protein HDU67_005095 [Dinochytrium kinnereticum]|nr:hypothetical protein HDU67_005095 [Dinochytrium kinnereticum]